MKSWIVGAAAAVLSIATPTFAEPSRPLALEAGVVMGLVAQPYASLAVIAGPWSLRASGGSGRGCDGQQLNVGRVLRDEANAKHTIGAVWARFNTGCWYGKNNIRSKTGRYVGLAYDFQVRGFFLEFGPAFGSKNPLGAGLGPLARVYGQVGYVYRFGKRYVDDDE
jgi:hypothetical protein